MKIVFPLLLILTALVPAGAQVCSGCSCRGGPGFRLPSGECSSWKQNEHYCDGACYPTGTADERHQPAPKPPIHKPAKP